MTSETSDIGQDGVRFRSEGGRRSTQRAGKAVFADAVRAVDPAVADKIMRTKDWRKGYLEPITDVVAAGAGSAKDALRIAADGLEALHRNLTFVTEDAEVSVRDAFDGVADPGFEVATVEGTEEPATELAVPYRGRRLRGDSLLGQLEAWEKAGILEPSCRAALELVVRNPDWLDLSDRYFALLGAASEMGPLEPLCSWQANVIAVDLPRPRLWEYIGATAAKGSGRLFAPARSAGTLDPSSTGADLLVAAPQISAWLTRFDQPFTLGNYVYADGATFARLAGIVDALVARLIEKRRDLSLAYLATPTDVFAVPSPIVEQTKARRKRSLPGSALRPLSGGRLYVPNYRRVVAGENGRSWGISDSLVPIQGPNYALAKSLQRWRALIAREEGTLSSANVAPASHTRSVTSNRVLAAAYRGAGSFGVEIFAPETSRFLTAALLVHDLRNPAAAAHPHTQLQHPFDLFAQSALHGGIWRLGYEARSILPLGVLIGLFKRA